MSKDKDKVDEVESLLPKDVYVTTVSGDKVKVPPLTWRKEIQVFRSLGKMIGEMPKIEIDPKDPSKVLGGLNLTELIPKLVEVLPDEITVLMETILDKEADWICDNLSAKEVIGFIVPFLQAELIELRDVLVPVFPALQDVGKKTKLR